MTAISVARQCHIVGHNQRIFLGDISETKVNGKNVITWKDFEFSDSKLNDEMEPELEYGRNPLNATDYAIDSPVKASAGPTGGFSDQPTSIQMDEDLSPTLQGEGIDFGIVDLEAPFFNMKDQENYCIAMTGMILPS